MASSCFLVVESSSLQRIDEWRRPKGTTKSHVTLCDAGDADGLRLPCAGKWAVGQASAGHEFEDPVHHSDAASGFHFDGQRTRPAYAKPKLPTATIKA
jgi:hypothetical protein